MLGALATRNARGARLYARHCCDPLFPSLSGLRVRFASQDGPFFLKD